jgi:hypothetical protein
MTTIPKETMQEVHTILQNIVAKLLVSKPDEPIPHIIQYLEDAKKQGAPALTKDERVELEGLR